MLTKHSQILIGWQEWCALPKLHLPAIKAKIDTGAKTSALHAEEIKPFHRHGELYVHFKVHPLQRISELAVDCTAPVVDHRIIMNSGGHQERRYIIHTKIILGTLEWDIDISLTNRAPLVFRMLLGRDALKHEFLIEPGKKLHQGKYTKRHIKRLYAAE